MKISEEQKNKLRRFLGQEIVEAKQRSDIREVKENVSKMNEEISKSMMSGLKDLERKVSKIQNTDLTPVIDALNKFTDTLVKNHKPQDLSGFFKDLGVQLAQTGKSTKDTKELIQTLKWNSTMGIKNRSGSPISPSVSPFQIPDYDDIKLSNYDANGNPGTVNYYLGGGLIASLTLTYDGSGNLTEAKRTQ